MQIFFKSINVSGEDTEWLESLDLNHVKYNYIVIALGDIEHNWLATSEIISRIKTAKEIGTAAYNGRIIINIFKEFSDVIEKSDQESLISDGALSGIEVNFFGDDVVNVESELERIARNINFSYEMKYDQRIGKAQTDKKFDNSKSIEFVQSPHDCDVGDLSVVSNFIGSEYTADSSFASAVHMPYKLAVCREYNENADAIDVLKEAVCSKNLLYKKLVALEHRRWNAYMVMRGYRSPSEKEETQVLYHGTNTHQDKEKLLHICLCDCGEKGVVLENDFNRQSFMA